jgi:hypothetical protein
MLTKAVSEMHSIQGLKSIDPIAHALYKTWMLERYNPSADVYLCSYNQLTDLIKDSAPIWKCGVGQHP